MFAKMFSKLSKYDSHCLEIVVLIATNDFSRYNLQSICLRLLTILCNIVIVMWLDCNYYIETGLELFYPTALLFAQEVYF